MKNKKNSPDTPEQEQLPEGSPSLKGHIGRRLKEVREALGLTQKELCAATGMPLPSLRGYELAQRIPGGDAIALLIKAGINANWLLTGEGQSLQTPPDTGSARYPEHTSVGYNTGETTTHYKLDPSEEQTHTILSHHPDLSTDILIFKKEWLQQELDAKPEDLSLHPVPGDGMDPTLRTGDIILVDHRANQALQEGIYLLRIGTMLLTRRLQSLPGGTINVSSDNPVLGTWQLRQTDIDGDEVTIIGRIVWIGRRI